MCTVIHLKSYTTCFYQKEHKVMEVEADNNYSKTLTIFKHSVEDPKPKRYTRVICVEDERYVAAGGDNIFNSQSSTQQVGQGWGCIRCSIINYQTIYART